MSSPFFLPLTVVSLSAQTVWKPRRVRLETSVRLCSHVSVKHIIIDSLYSVWLMVSNSSLSILFAGDLTFYKKTAGIQGLNLPFYILTLTPVL